jgi:phenylalanyl-tRNA synthetase beta chain
MRVALSWLATYVPLPESLDELVATLDDLGLVVEDIEHVGLGLDGVVVVQVQRIDAIEGADRIRLVTVLDKGAPVQVVCGAWNFEVGSLVPFAPVGTVLRDGTAISRRTMRGVVSNGMLCSGRELGVGDDHEGLLVLDESAATLGQPIAEVLGVARDVVLDIAIEGNRPDAWCVEGVARDLAARYEVAFHRIEPDPPAPNSEGAGSAPVKVEIVDPDLCGRFVATVLHDVEVAESPRWLARRLELAGMRPINNVVDASNYVMLELGQPTHAYDLDGLAGHAIRVRRAVTGEELELLDGSSIELAVDSGAIGDTGEDLAICDGDDVPIGLAGVMGGSSSEIGPATTSVVLEAAWFEPIGVARTAKRHRLRTEASVRFERGCDYANCDRASARFVELLAMSSPGLRVVGAPVDVRGELPPPASLRVDADAIEGVLGVRLGLDEVARLLSAIGFDVADRDGTLEVTAPSGRPDVRAAPFGVADVAEEVARLHGYAALPTRVPSWPAPGGLTHVVRVRRAVREALVGIGALEAWTAAIVPADDAQLLGDEDERVRLTNPVAADAPFLRSSLMPGLLGAVRRNAERRQGDLALFEIGVVFTHPSAAPTARVERGGAGGGDLVKLPSEDERVSLLLARPHDDARSAVAAWRALATALRLSHTRLDPISGTTPLGLHPTRCAAIVDASTGAVLGHLGEVDPDLAARAMPGLDEGRRLGWVDVSMGVLADCDAVLRESDVASVPSRYPTSDVDLAFVLDESVHVEELKAVLCDAAGELCESVECFDAYRGPGVPPGSRSLAMRVRLCAPDRTLSEEALASTRVAMIDAATGSLSATLR